MYKAADSAQELLDTIWERNVELGITVPETDCITISYPRSFGDKTIEEVILGMEGHEGQKAAYWTIYHALDLIPENLRDPLFDLVISSPQLSARLYYKSEYLTQSEKIKLWKAFCDVLPVTVAKLEPPDGL